MAGTEENKIQQEPEETKDNEPSFPEEDLNSQVLAESRQQLEELQGRYARLAADFDNFRKRTERQNRDLVVRANENLICGLLPVLDNFQLALGSIHDESILKGVKMIYDQLLAVLENAGLAAIETVGGSFDPEFHEAIAREESEEQEDNIILEELRRGYLLGGKVLRPSMVKVNFKKEE